MTSGAAANMTVLCCRGDGDVLRALGDDPVGYDDVPAALRSSDLGPVLAACRDVPIHVVGPRPKKAIDPLLTGRVLVIGDDADLNAVVLRLLRKELLATVEIAYAPATTTDMTRLHSLPTGAHAVALARTGTARTVPLARHDSGGVLVGRGELAPIGSPFYIDARRIPGGRAKPVTVSPHPDKGLAIGVGRSRRFGIPRRPETHLGRAVEFAIPPGQGTTITFDGIRHPREAKRWVFYAHTEPLLLVMPAP